MEKIIAYTAGKTRGNPGLAAAGVCVVNGTGEILQEATKSLGNSTPIFSEYSGVLLALQILRQLYGEETRNIEFEINLADRYVVQQLSNKKEIIEPGLVPMFIELHNARICDFPQLSFKHIKTEQNHVVNRLVDSMLEG